MVIPMQQDVQNNRKVFADDTDLIYMSYQKNKADNTLSRNIVSVKITGEGDENTVIDI